MKKLLHTLLLGLCILAAPQALWAQEPEVDDAQAEQLLQQLELSQIYFSQGRYEEALHVTKQVAEQVRQLVGEESEEYLYLCYSLGQIHYMCANYQEALACYLRVKQAWQDDPEKQAELLRDIIGIYNLLGDTGQAMQAARQQCELTARFYGEHSRPYARALHDMGIVLHARGDYPQAMQCFRRTLEIQRELLPDRHPDSAETLFQIGNIHSDWGNTEETLKYYEQVREIYLLEYGEYDLRNAAILNNIGNVHFQREDYRRALACYEEAAECLKNADMQLQFLYPLLLNNIGNCYDNLGDFDRALAYGREALELRRQLLGEHHPDYAISLSNVASVYRSRGDLGQAMRYSLEAHRIIAETKGRSHPDYALSLNNLCFILAEEHPEQALPYAQELLEVTRKFIADNFLYLTEREREQFAAKYNNYLEAVKIGSAVNREEDGATLYDVCLLSNGLLLGTTLELEKLIRESGRPELTALAEQLRSVRRRLDALAPERTEERTQLQAEADRLEHTLIDNVPALGRQLQNLQVTWQEVQQRLGPDEAAIEFAQYRAYGADVFAVSILRRDYTVPQGFVYAYDTENILSSDLDAAYYDHVAFGQTIWQEIAKHLHPGDHVYFAPAGWMHRVAVEYLPISEEERMCDRYHMHRVSSTRQLVLGQEAAHNATAALYGGLNYNTDIDEMAYYAAVAGERGATDRYTADRGVQHRMWGYLDGTREEVQQIEPLLREQHYATQLYVGEAGVEESFKALSGMRTGIIHIATHGFYLPAGQHGSGFGRMVEADNEGLLQEDRSLLRSGLIFAGANNRSLLPEALDDGVLTAKEISLLDLRGADLVVLSACQTGLGDVTGEGVFGLPRAFKKAGAQTLLMSLWSVSDAATQVMMTAFYRELAAGKSKREAFLAAQNEVKRHTFTEADGSQCSGEDPRYWAAFVMMD